MSLIAVWPLASLMFTLPANALPLNLPAIDHDSPAAHGGFEPLPG
jgi:hypothetical protein